MKSCNKIDCIIAIESSCDETGVCIMSMSGKILYENLKSQILIHQEYGGVVPNIASKMHTRNIQLIKNDIQKQIKNLNIKYVFATIGPGLIGCLLLGVMFGKGISSSLNVPFVPINHLLGHIFSVNIGRKVKITPNLVVLLSGGHSMFITNDKDKFKIIGKTIDDSIGEAFDKIAKILGMPYPGGPEIEKKALNFNTTKHELIKFPLPLAKEDNANLSLSGLKTSVIRFIVKKMNKKGYRIKNNSDIAKYIKENDKIEISFSFQYAIKQILEIKIKKAIEIMKSKNIELSNIIICGGVAANKVLLNSFQDIVKHFNIKLYYPKIQYCSDNATMIAEAAMNILQKEKNNLKKIDGIGSDVFSRGADEFVNF